MKSAKLYFIFLKFEKIIIKHFNKYLLYITMRINNTHVKAKTRNFHENESVNHEYRESNGN